MDHSALDDRIVGAIRSGKTSFTTIMAELNYGRIPTDSAFVGSRRVDQRLQALRKKDQILWTGSAHRSGWKLPEVKPL